MKREDSAGRKPHIQQNMRTNISAWLTFTRKLPSIHRTVLDPRTVKAWFMPSPLSQHTTAQQNEPEAASYNPSPNPASANLNAEHRLHNRC